MVMREGTCCICQQSGKLSFEHVHPHKAFNQRPLVLKSALDEIADEKKPNPSKGRTQQRGMGMHSLCVSCNNLTGHRYGGEYVEFAHQCMCRISALQPRMPPLYLNYFIFPLRVIKQIMCLFCSINGPSFTAHNPEIADFILDRDRKHLPCGYKIYAYLTMGPGIRSAPFVGRGLIPTGEMTIFSELSFPPLGYILTKDDYKAKGVEYQRLDFLSRYRYADWKTVPLRMPYLPTATWVPGDFRTRDEADACARKNAQLI